MKPVMQTKFGDEGNCFNAAVASILELKINQVPRIDSEDDWWLVKWRKWLGKRGMSIEWYSARNRRTPRGWAIGRVTGRKFHKDGHAVVFYNGKPKHDPKSCTVADARRARVAEWYVFTVNNPAKVKHK